MQLSALLFPYNGRSSRSIFCYSFSHMSAQTPWTELLDTLQRPQCKQQSVIVYSIPDISVYCTTIPETYSHVPNITLLYAAGMTLLFAVVYYNYEG